MPIQCCGKTLITLFLGLFFLTLSGATEAENFFAGTAGIRTISSPFTQNRKIRGLSRPIKVTGQFYMDRAGRFAWITETPIRYFCIIENKQLRQWDAASGKSITLDLKRHAALAAMSDSMTNFFAGRIPNLEQNFKYKILSAHKIVLTPQKGAMAYEILESLEVTLSQNKRGVEHVRIREKNGDMTEIHFYKLQFDQEIPPEIWKTGGR